MTISTQKQSSRLQWLDVAKGITIILMILGHTSIPGWLSNFIFAFHMPLFFIASGWCTNWAKDNYGAFLFKKLRTLGIPFLVYSVAVILIARLAEFQDIGWCSVLANGWKGYALWFVPVLFFSLVVAKSIMCFISQKWLRYVICGMLILGGAILRYCHIYFPWTLATVPYATFLILLGSSLRKFQEYIDKPRWLILIVSLLLTIVISQNWRMDLAWNCITPVIFLTLGAVAGTVMMFTFSSYLTKVSWPSIILQVIGMETFVIMAFSQILCLAISHLFSCNKIIEYAIVFSLLLIIVLFKNGINKLLGNKIL